MAPNHPVEVPDRYPPLSVWSECDAAARRVDELSEDGREVHFEIDQATARLVIEVRDLDGDPLRRLTTCDAVAIAGGALA